MAAQMTSSDVYALRAKARAERMKQFTMMSNAPRTVHVIPATPEYRQYLKHLPSGIGFPKEGGAEWPYDQFTKRRIRDKSISVSEKMPEAKPEGGQRKVETK
jgi:hypothetical protein